MNYKTPYLTLALTLTFFVNSEITIGQNNNVKIEKDVKIDTLLKLKSALNKDDKSSKKYKIQIYSGTRDGANKQESLYKQKYTDWSSTHVFETPNHKIWVGNFRTRLEADRALVEISKTFERAFIFKPKKEKK